MFTVFCNDMRSLVDLCTDSIRTVDVRCFVIEFLG